MTQPVSVVDEVVEEKIKVSLNIDKLKFRELLIFEEVTGKPMSDMVKMRPVLDPATGRPTPDPDDPKGRPLMEAEMSALSMAAMVLIARKRDDPEVTWDDVLDMDLSAIDFGVETENPTDAPESAEQS